MATAAKGHMPFRESIRPAPPAITPASECIAFVPAQPRNQKLIDETNLLAGRWR